MNSVVVERNVPTDIPAIWLLRTFWSEESIRKLDCYCHWLGGHWQYIFGRRSICSKCGETGKVDVSQNYVDRVMSEAMPNAVVWTGFAIRNEKTGYKKYWERKQNSSKNRWHTKALDVHKSSVQLNRLFTKVGNCTKGERSRVDQFRILIGHN